MAGYEWGQLVGRIKIGSREPVTDFPLWLTPEIVRGGFATGVVAAAGPPHQDEIVLAELVKVRPTAKNCSGGSFLAEKRSVRVAPSRVLFVSGRYG